MKPAALRDLGRLTEARKNRDLARLEQLMAAARALDAELATLAATAATDAACGETLPPDRQAVRLAWIDQQTAAIRRRRSALIAAIDKARAAAVQSLGRERALDRVTEAALRAERSSRDSRIEREAPPPPPGRAGSVAE